jgi:quercetin dioxygenase-like cupin family protein
MRSSEMTQSLREDRRRDLFGGHGEVVVRDLLGAGALPPFSAVLACELEPRGSVGTHHQTEFAEIVVFTGGEGKVTVSGVSRAVLEGSLVLLPLGESLAIDNTSESEPLRYLIVKAARSS